MTIEEYCDIMGLQIIVTYLPNKHWSAKISGSVIFEPDCDIHLSGDGSTALEAIADYVTKIRGKRIEIYHYSDPAPTLYQIPKKLGAKQ